MIKPMKCACGCGEDGVAVKTPLKGLWHWVISANCLKADAFKAMTRLGAILRWNWRQWRARRKCGTCRFGMARNDNGLSVECRCIISPKYRLAMSAEKHHCWAWRARRKMKGEAKI